MRNKHIATTPNSSRATQTVDEFLDSGFGFLSLSIKAPAAIGAYI
jgi:hypothetical protein